MAVTAIGVIAVAATGCANNAVEQVQRLSSSPSTSPTPPTPLQKHVLRGTGHLHMTITPATGPVGTEVSITATGCGDPSGDSHAVSFNPGFGDTGQATQAHYDGFIPSRLTDQVLNAKYTIRAADARAAARPGASPTQFYVQCRDDDAEAAFSISP